MGSRVEMSPLVARDTTLEMSLEMPKVCCEPLAGPCQKIITVASFLVGGTSIGGVVYSILIDNKLFPAFCGACILYCCSVIVMNLSCGNISRIHSQFLSASQKLVEFKQREDAALEKYQKEIAAFQGTLKQNEDQIRRLTQLEEESKTTAAGLQTNLDTMGKKSEELSRIDQGLKQTSAEKKQIASNFEETVDALSKQMEAFHINVVAAGNASTEVINGEKALKEVVDAVVRETGVLHEAFQVISHQATVSSAENKRLNTQLQLIQEQLSKEKRDNQSLVVSLQALRLELGNDKPNQ